MSKEKTIAAVDLGASSGRVIVGRFANDSLALEEAHRFPNGFHELNGNAYWDAGRLLAEIHAGIRAAKSRFQGLTSVGVDTWGVDHALLDKNFRLVYPTHAYRDTRTEPIRARILDSGDAPRLYEMTGLPVINYNTGLQLMETLAAAPSLRGACERVLMLSDYFNFLLSGEAVNEFSQASTTQLLDVRGNDFSAEALEYFGVPAEWFAGPVTAGRILGPLRGVEDADGVSVSLVPGHDTSCAFEAIPREGNSLIVSSGTWNLVGTICDAPLLSNEARDLGISNERCGDGGYRPCKILLGLWLLERTLPAFQGRPQSDGEWEALTKAAEAAAAPTTLIDLSDESLFNPRDMRAAIDAQLTRKGDAPPTDLAAYVRLICASLARGIADTAEAFASIAGRDFDNIVMVGGGSKNRLLCQELANASGMDVTSYALEATSVGNLGYQLLALGEVNSITAFHDIIRPNLEQRRHIPRA